MFLKYKTGGMGYKIIKKIGILQLLSIVCMIFTIQIWQVHGFGRISLVVFMVGIVSALLTSIMAIKDSINGQLLINTVISFILEISALLILYKNHTNLRGFLGNGNFSIFFISLTLLAIIQIFQFIKTFTCSKTGKKDIKNILLVVIFLTILIGIGIQFLNQWPRWDSAAYYFQLDQLSAANIFQNLNKGMVACGHPAGAWVLLSFLFETIPFISKINALLLSNIFLMILAFFLIYYILRKLLNFRCIYIYSILSFIFTVSPYILGSITNINPEHLCSVGVLIFLCGVIQNNYFLNIIACYIVCNTRETGLPIIASLILIQLIYDLHSTNNWRAKFFTTNWLYYISSIFIGFSWLLLFSNVNWSQGMSTDFQSHYIDGTRMFKFGVSIQYIINQLKGIFLTNFTWLYSIIILITFLLVVRLNKKYSMFKKLCGTKLYIMILIGMVVSVVEICLFLTHHNYRYYTLPILFIQLTAILGFSNIASKLTYNRFIKVLPISLIGVLLFIQCFTTIDPVMLSLFPTIDTGKSKIAVMPWNIDNLPDIQFLEGANYNFQIPYFDKALNIVYSDIEAEESKVLIYDGYQWGTTGNTLNSIWGYGYEYLTPPAWGVWNSHGKYRELSYKNDNVINPIPIKKTSEVQKYLKKDKNVYYIELPWGDKLIDSLRSKYKNMQVVKTVQYHGWVLKVYKMQ